MKWPHLFHRWEIVKDATSHRYEQCRVCQKRRIVWDSRFSGFTVHDQQWVETGRWHEPGPPPWGDTGPTGTARKDNRS